MVLGASINLGALFLYNKVKIILQNTCLIVKVSLHLYSVKH